MTRPNPPPLLGAPYRTPRLEPGALVECQYRGTVRVLPLSAAPIPWPTCSVLASGIRPVPILYGDLVRAVRTESARAIAHHWGVSIDLVSDWRRALGVGRMTPGTARIWSEAARAKLHDTGADSRGGQTSARQLNARHRT